MTSEEAPIASGQFYYFNPEFSILELIPGFMEQESGTMVLKSATAVRNTAPWMRPAARSKNQH
jgi:hypothetical protein